MLSLSNSLSCKSFKFMEGMIIFNHKSFFLFCSRKGKLYGFLEEPLSDFDFCSLSDRVDFKVQFLEGRPCISNNFQGPFIFDLVVVQLEDF